MGTRVNIAIAMTITFTCLSPNAAIAKQSSSINRPENTEAYSTVGDVLVKVTLRESLPNAFGGYDETPADMARVLGEFAANGWLNLVGGCCGSTPAHIAAIAQAVHGRAPRMLPQAAQALRLSGLEPLVVA